jgi:hypothetical protein
MFQLKKGAKYVGVDVRFKVQKYVVGGQLLWL